MLQCDRIDVSEWVDPATLENVLSATVSFLIMGLDFKILFKVYHDLTCCVLILVIYHC